MHAYDLDKAHQERYHWLLEREMCDGCVEEGRTFSNPHVAALYRADKLLLTRFNRAEILTLLPFTPTLFVEICPQCITGSNFETMNALCKAGLMIPILTAPYQMFPAPVVESVAGADHVSFWEFRFHRTEFLLRADEQKRCRCGVMDIEKRILARAPRRNIRSRKWNRLDADILFENLRPYVAPDDELLALVNQHMRAKRMAALHHLTHVSFAVREVRTAQAFNAGLVANGLELQSLPSYIMAEADETRRLAFSLKTLASEGLGLRLPDCIPVRPYIDLIRDLRGHLPTVAEGVLKLASTPEGLVDAPAVCRILAELNREIERVQRSKRYLVWEAAVGLMRGGLKLAIPLVAAKTAVRILLDRVAPSESLPASRRESSLGPQTDPIQDILVPRFLRYLQPYMDKVTARLFGSNVLAMQVLSSRRHLGKVSKAARRESADVTREPHCHLY
jgi:hypothetical protein